MRETVIHLAVRMRDLETVKMILDDGEDINMRDDDGNTPLSLAIESGSPRMVELILKHNPDMDVDAVREKFYQCLLTSTADDELIIKSIVQCGFTVKNTDNTHAAMVWASIMLGLQDLAVSLVEHNKSFLKSVEIWYRSFMLHTQPYKKSQAKALRIIVKIKDLFINEEDICMSGNRNLDLFKVLLSEGDVDLINVNTLSTEGNFDDNQETDIVDIMKDVLLSCYDGDNPVCDEKGRTGLHYAAKVGNVGVIQALLDMHLDVNDTDDDGKTPLDYIYDRINEFYPDESEEFHNEKHLDTEFDCYYTLLDLKLGAVVFLKHVSKLITAQSYIPLNNLKTVKALLMMMNNDPVIMQYYLSIYSCIEQCELEIELLKQKRLGELSYFDFLKKDCNQIALYTTRQQVIDAFQSSDELFREFDIYGPTLQHRFYVSSLRRGLLEKSENILLDIMKWLQISLVVVREILSHMNNRELYFLVSKA